MNISRICYPLGRRNFRQNIIRNYKISSSNYESSQTTQSLVKEEKFDFEDVKVLERSERRKPAIPPFMKNVAIAVFDRELLAFPEILNKEEDTDLNERVKRIDYVFSDESKTSDDRKKTLLNNSLYAAPISLTIGGLAMNVTERIRYLETISSDLDLSKKLSDHWVGLQAVTLGLTEKELHELLPKLTNGEQLIKLCVKEKISIRVSQPDLKTTASLDGHGNDNI